MADYLRFSHKWSALVKPLSSKDGLPEWQAFVEACKNEAILMESVEYLGEIAEAKRQGGFPIGLTLQSLKAEYFKRYGGGNAEFRKTNCPYCAGRGFAVVVVDIRKSSAIPHNRGAVACLTAWPIHAPCFCAEGRNWHKMQNGGQADDQPRNWQDCVFKGCFETPSGKVEREFTDGWFNAERFAEQCREMARSAISANAEAGEMPR